MTTVKSLTLDDLRTAVSGSAAALRLSLQADQVLFMPLCAKCGLGMRR